MRAQALNWQLSCDRAEAVKAELVAQGIPAGKITTFAHGESTEFSTSNLAQNRRAIITTQPVPGPPPPAPAPPGPGPAPAPPAAATITSEAVLASPAPRNRTKIGVGEDVKLNSFGRQCHLGHDSRDLEFFHWRHRHIDCAGYCPDRCRDRWGRQDCF